MAGLVSDNGTRYVCMARPSSGKDREQGKEKRNEADEETKKDRSARRVEMRLVDCAEDVSIVVQLV